ncbi:unnamed protein product, partial [Meganyctiphanes norvegica]
MHSAADEEEGKLKKLESFEDLMELVGTNGRWNIMIFVLASWCGAILPFQNLSYQFVGNTPDHWCQVEELHSANWTQQQILDLAIPDIDESGGKSSCSMYNYDYKLAVELGYEESISRRDTLAAGVNNTHNITHAEFSTPISIPGVNDTVICSKRNFNFTDFQPTVVTEWDLVCDRRALYSSTQAASQGGKFLGSLCFGYLLEKFGRRPPVLGSVVMTLITGFAAAVAPSLQFYIFLRAAISASATGIYMGNIIFCMELCSSRQRGLVAIMFVLPWALGYMILPGIAYAVREWHWLQAALTLPTTTLLIYFWLLPESPRWLVLHGRHEEALDVLKWAARVNKRELPTDATILQAMETIQDRVSQAGSENTSGTTLDENKLWFSRIIIWLQEFFALVRNRQLLPRTLAVFFCWFAAAGVYYGVALNSDNLSTDKYMYTFLGGLLEVPSYLLLWPAVHFLGRKKSLVILYSICTVAICVVAIIMLVFPTAPVWIRVLFSLVGKMAITAAFHLIWFFTVELFPTRYRSQAVAQSSVCGRLGSVFSPYVNDILGLVSTWAPSALFASVSVVAAILSTTLPETGNKELVEGYSDENNDTSPKHKVTNELQGNRNC